MIFIFLFLLIKFTQLKTIFGILLLLAFIARPTAKIGIVGYYGLNIKNTSVLIIVGNNAYNINFKGDIPFLKCFFKIETPIGLAALAMIVKPPPEIAPDTMAYFNGSEKFGTSVAK